MIDSVLEVLIDMQYEIKKRLDLGLDGGPEVAEEIEDDADGDQGVVLVVVGEDLKGELEELLDDGAEDLAVREAVEDLDDDVPELVLDVLRQLRGRDLGEDELERVKIAFEEIQVLARVGDLEAVSDLHHHLKPRLNREFGFDEALGVKLVVEDGSHGGRNLGFFKG